eukprot:362009-Chlamydomonas_euryale.AAC.11
MASFYTCRPLTIAKYTCCAGCILALKTRARPLGSCWANWFAGRQADCHRIICCFRSQTCGLHLRDEHEEGRAGGVVECGPQLQRLGRCWVVDCHELGHGVPERIQAVECATCRTLRPRVRVHVRPPRTRLKCDAGRHAPLQGRHVVRRSRQPRRRKVLEGREGRSGILLECDRRHSTGAARPARCHGVLSRCSAQ